MKLAIAVAAILLSASCAPAAQERPCPRIAKPVCALKGTARSTFSNSCAAATVGAKILHDGACEGGDMCSMIYNPVCALDPATGHEKTYSSLCVSEHANASVAHEGECKTP